MIEFHLGKIQLRPTDVYFESKLGESPRAKVCLGEGSDPPQKDAVARLVMGGRELAMRLGDWAVPPGGLPGGWMELAPAIALAAPYVGEVYSGPQGTSFRKALETRTEVNGPPDLAANLPTVVADGPVNWLLEDICSRHPQWAWWVGPSGAIELGIPGNEVTASDGIVLVVKAGGFVARLSGVLPLPGEAVELPGGRRDLVLSVRFEWHAGHLPHIEIVAGNSVPCRRHAPGGEIRCPARIEQLAPLVVRVTDEERARRPFSARAILMVRRSDGGRFQEDVPLAVGDEGEAVIPTGGISVLPLRFYLWRPGAPSSQYCMTARSKQEVVAETWSVKARRMSESANEKETETGRYDIKKKR